MDDRDGMLPQWAARASCPSSLLWGSVTELVLHAVPCLAIENCLVLPAVAGGLRCVCRIRVRGHQSGRREDHAQADWAELDAIDDHRERFSPRRIAPEIVAKRSEEHTSEL